MISSMINRNNRNEISERDIVYALEKNGYTNNEIDEILDDVKEEQKQEKKYKHKNIFLSKIIKVLTFIFI